MSLYDSMIFKAKRQLYMVKNALIYQLPPHNAKRARSAAFDKIRNIFFINVCSDDCLTAKADEYLLLSYVFNENWPRVELLRFHIA